MPHPLHAELVLPAVHAYYFLQVKKTDKAMAECVIELFLLVHQFVSTYLFLLTKRMCVYLPISAHKKNVCLPTYFCSQMEKTDKTMAEMNIELNLSYEFDKITEAGEALEALAGPG